MPQASNFTIKDGASSPADTLFTNLQPAGGTLPAYYVARSKGPAAASQPSIRVSSEGKAGSRKVTRTIRTPYFVTGSDGVSKVVDYCMTTVTTTLPDTVPDTVRADHQAYVANSSDVAQISEAERGGFAPN